MAGLVRWLRRSDELLLRALGGRGGPAVDRVLTSLSWAADRSKLWIAASVTLGLIGGPRGRRAAARGLVSIALASALVNGPLKLLSGRARPPLLDEAPTSGLLRPPVTSSFPSGHTASAVAFATAAGAQVPEALPPLALLAGAVAYSRIHARVHYPSDVVVGAVVGVAAAAAGSRLLDAFQRHRRSSPPGPWPTPPVPARAVLVTSPHAGRAARGLEQARRALALARVEVVAEISVSDLSDPDRPLPTLGEGGTPLVIAAGGDGTVGAVCDRIAGTPTVLGVIPLGTSNDFARSVGIPVDVERAVALLRRGKVSTIDLGRFVAPGDRPRHFAHAATAGLNVRFARLATQASLRHRLGRLTYLVAAALALRKRYPFRCRLSFEGRSEELELEELAIINAPVFGGFLGLRLGNGSLDDRRLDVLAIEEARLPRLTLAALLAVLGVGRRVRGVRSLRLKRLDVHTDEQLEVTLDGEVLGRLPASFEVAEEALRIVTPLDFES